jgi:hypothetical protein
MGMSFKDNLFEILCEERMVLTCHHKNTTFHQKVSNGLTLHQIRKRVTTKGPKYQFWGA